MGTAGFASAELIWRNCAPPRCKFFLWLATRDRCWTADRLAKRGMDHPVQCPLCDQGDETVQHLLISCVFSREVWFRIFSLVNLRQFSPTRADLVFQVGGVIWRPRPLMCCAKGLTRDVGGMVALEAAE
jgi:hypothetical protein